MMKWCLIPERFPYLYMKSKVRKSRHVRVTGNLRWRRGVGRVKEGERVVTLDGYRYLHFPLLFLLSPLPKQVRPMFEAKNKEKTIKRITEIWPVSWSINYKVPTKACQQFRYETVLVPWASYRQTFNLLNLTGELYYSGLVDILCMGFQAPEDFRRHLKWLPSHPPSWF